MCKLFWLFCRIVLLVTYVKVAIAKLHTGCKLFTYKSTKFLNNGDVVEVPFGNKKTFGIVIKKTKNPSIEFIKLKLISQRLDYTLPKISIDLMKWMFDFYPDDFGLITRLFVPSDLLVKNREDIDIIKGKKLPLPKPTAEQSSALKIILNKNNNRIMLHGDTGTGKTRVFVDKIRQAIASGKSVLVLTPEIGLTPQLVNDIAEHIHAPIILNHSKLTSAQKRKIWQYALSAKEPAVFTGPRSTLFLPFSNIGLIVIDESHDASYKQNSAPRYQSLHIASFLAGKFKAQIIQSTATPNIDDYYKAKAQGYKFIRMRSPAAGTYASKLHLIDITDRKQFTESPYLSNRLIDSMTKALESKEQIMLFLNRRGSARILQCNDCGWQAICSNCGLPLIYHHDLHLIRCHSCSHKEKSPNFCPSCKSTNLLFKNMGTKALYEHVSKIFKGFKIMRFDADSTSENQYHKYIEKLKSGDVDIIIGTQIISKGIDLPKLSVVGIINADSGLNFPDFRAEEVTYQQIYQTVGRAARGHRLNKSFVQSRLPGNDVITSVMNREWGDFYTYEISKRKLFYYPPFCYLAILKINKKVSLTAQNNCQKIYDYLKTVKGIKTLGPSPSFYEKRAGVYAWQIILKSNKRSTLVSVARKLPKEWTIDIDPISLL